MEHRWHHVVRKRVAEPVPQRGGIEWPVARVESHQALAAARSLGDHDRGLADAWHAQQCVFDLADLDSKAPDLHLGIPAAEELQLAVGQPAAVITAAVESLTSAVRIRHECSPRAFCIVDVAAADADAGEDDFSWRTERHGCEMLVHD